MVRSGLYLEVPPLMSLLQGASSRLLGVGVWQMRYLPVVYGMLTPGAHGGRGGAYRRAGRRRGAAWRCC